MVQCHLDMSPCDILDHLRYMSTGLVKEVMYTLAINKCCIVNFSGCRTRCIWCEHRSAMMVWIVGNSS